MNDFLKGGIVGFFGGWLAGRSKPAATRAEKVKAQDEVANAAINFQNSIDKLNETFKDEKGDTADERFKNGMDGVITGLSGITVNQLQPEMPLHGRTLELYNEISREQGKDKAEEFKKIFLEEQRKSEEYRRKRLGRS